MIVLLAILAALSAHPITEDSSRWNCHTMGNHVCGDPLTYRR